MPNALPQSLSRWAGRIDSLTAWVGRRVAWLVLLMMLLMVATVLMRYVLGMGSIAVQESVMYLHGAVFLLASAFTLQQDGHVRVDIFYRRFTPLQQAWVNLLGSLFLLMPVCLTILLMSWHYVLISWQRLETSADAGGLPLVYVLKSLLLLLAALLVLQGIAEICRNLSRILDPTDKPDLDNHKHIGA